MVELKLTNAYSPMLFSVNGYQVVVIPMLTDYANEQQKADREATLDSTFNWWLVESHRAPLLFESEL